MVSYLLHHRYVPIKLHMNFIGDQLTFHRFFSIYEQTASPLKTAGIFPSETVYSG